MRWEDERYVRFYTRDTADWLMLSWQAQGLFGLIMRKVDRAGVLELGRQGKRGLAAHIGGPSAWAQLEPHLDELLDDGCIELQGDRLVVPNFIEAQETPTSDKERKRIQRERARDEARRNGDDASARKAANDVTPCPDLSGDVTDGHAESREVTPYCTDPCRTEPNLALDCAPPAAPAPPQFELVSQEPPPAKPPKAEKPKRKPTRCPTSTDDSARSFIEEWGIPNFDGPNGAEVAKMLDHHGAKGSTFLDWRAVWRTWDTNADAFGKRTHGPARVVAKPRPPPTREPPRPTAAPPPIEQNLGMARDALRKLGGA